MNKKIRLAVAFILVAISVSLLIWGYLPNPRVAQDRQISPAEMLLPTPSSLHFYPLMLS